MLTPLFPVAGTFFPLSELPQWAQILGNFNPLFHCVQLVRHVAFGWQGWADIGHLAALTGFALVTRACVDLAPGEAADRLAPTRHEISRDPTGQRFLLSALARIGDAAADGPPFVWPDGSLGRGLAVPICHGVHVGDHLGGIADDHRPRRYVATHDGTGGNDRVVTNPRSGEDDRSGTEEDAIADDDRGDQRVIYVPPHARVVNHDDRPR